MESMYSTIIYLALALFFYLRKNRYGWSQKEFSEIIRNHEFRKIEEVARLRKHLKKITIICVFYIMFLIFGLSCGVTTTILFSSSTLSIEESSSMIYLDFDGVWYISGFSDNGTKTLLKLDGVWYMNIVNIICLLGQISCGYFYLKYINLSNFSVYSWSDKLETPKKILWIKYENNNLQKVYLIISSIAILTFSLFVGFYTEKPNIDGFIDNNEKLFLFQHYKIEEFYGTYYIESSVAWYSIILVIIYFICIVLNATIVLVADNKLLVQVQNQLVILYKENFINKDKM